MKTKATTMKRGLTLLAALLLAPLAALYAGEPEPQLKTPLIGLVAMGGIGFHRVDGGLAQPGVDDVNRVPGIFGGMVINVTWAQLEAQRGVLDTKIIDDVLDKIRLYNRANAQHPLGARLRVWPGPNAPVWVKNLGAAPVTVLHKDMPITVGRFWSKPYRDAWRELQAKLAAHYDAEPLIREISNTSGSSMTDESILLPGDPESVKSMRAAGFTDAQFQACLWESPEDYTGWASTRVECVCNPYRAIDSGKTRTDPDFTLKLMRHWRQTLGARGVLSNHALNEPAEHADIYDEMRRLGPPIAFQTHSPSGLNWDGALRLGQSYGAGSIELWSGTKFGGFEKQDPQRLREWAASFQLTHQNP